MTPPDPSAMAATPPASSVRGFLDDAEGLALHRLARDGLGVGPALEIGSYCGRSTIWLAQAAREGDSVVFAVDHHRGSEEHQPGEYFHDPDLTDAAGRFDSLPAFRANIDDHGLAAWVIPVVCSSRVLAGHWRTPLGLLFIDGGHSLEAALADYRSFAPWVSPGGILAIHDVFPDPAAGGQAPFAIWQLAQQSGLFAPLAEHGSLRALRRLGP